MLTNLPDGFVARPPGAADLAAMVALFNASSQDTQGTPRVRPDRFRRWWRSGEFDPAGNAVVVTNAAGQMVGLSLLFNPEPRISSQVMGAVLPAYRDLGLGSAMLAWAERRAGLLAALAPAGARVVLSSHVFDANRPAVALLEGTGFHLARRWVHLRIAMDSPPPLPAWPEGASVSPVGRDDWPPLLAALEEAFVDHWGYVPGFGHEEDGYGNGLASEEERQSAAGDPYFNSRGLCFVARHGAEVVASCLCNARTVEWPAAGYVGSLSVRRPYRRRGLALALLRHACGEFYRRGTRLVLTDTDAASFTGANNLYLKAGMTPYRYGLLYEKEVRPGTELRRLAPPAD